jgi:hypothetical protein
MYNSVEIKKKADLAKVFGKVLSDKICKEFGGGLKQVKPKRVYFHEEKPSFALSSGDTLHAFGVNLKEATITGKKYCGSEDSAFMHQKEQFGEGGCPEDGQALCFVHAYWNGRNHSWTITVVSKNFTKQLEE